MFSYYGFHLVSLLVQVFCICFGLCDDMQRITVVAVTLAHWFVLPLLFPKLSSLLIKFAETKRNNYPNSQHFHRWQRQRKVFFSLFYLFIWLHPINCVLYFIRCINHKEKFGFVKFKFYVNLCRTEMLLKNWKW